MKPTLNKMTFSLNKVVVQTIIENSQHKTTTKSYVKNKNQIKLINPKNLKTQKQTQQGYKISITSKIKPMRHII